MYYILDWSDNAVDEYLETLEYWELRNGTNTYSLKIMKEIDKVSAEIAADPISLSYYIPTYKVYRKSLLKGKFYLFYIIEGKVIHILHFRSVKQAPLYE